MQPLKLLVVADHKPFRSKLRTMLEDIPGIRVVGETGIAENAIATLPVEKPDLVLLDITRSGLDGQDVIPHITHIRAQCLARDTQVELSPRQAEVLAYLANGRGTREIAEQLGISIKTVETHRALVMEKLGIKDLASLVRYAIRHGIVPL
jgi:DNA-binding NarL/FixJ family response regulator